MYTRPFLDWFEKTEDYVGLAYLDQGGRWAYGYGYSNLLPGLTVSEGDKIGQPEAEELLVKCLDFIWNKVSPHIVAPETLPQDARGIISSLCYNGGVRGFLDSDVLTMINNVQKRYNLLYAAELILHYKVTAKDKFTGVRREMIGLKGRRIDEAYWFKKDLEYNDNGTAKAISLPS